MEKYTLVAKRLGIWVENDAHTPKIGDACVYDWDDKGAGDCTGAGDHIGIVTQVGTKSFVVTEGNMSGGRVGTRTMAVNGKYIRGFIAPDFAAIAKKISGVAAEVTLVTHTVKAGDTLGRIASKYGVTLDTLVKINGIKNPNVIHVGQVVALTTGAAAAYQLARVGVINSPAYWAEAAEKTKYLGTLLAKAAEKITKAGIRTATPEEGVAALVAAGIINTPAYWLANYNTFPNLGLLLCALGGAVK